MVKIGIIGTGMVAKIHMLGFRVIKELNLMDVEVSKVADIDQVRLKKFQNYYQIKDGTNDYQNILKDKEIDVVFICTPTNTHKKIFLDALDSGKPIFIEKPLSTNLLETLEMIKHAKSASQIIQVGFVLRYHPIIEHTKRLILENKDSFGKFMTIILRNDEYFPIQDLQQTKWRSDKEIAGGGVLLEHGIHDVDLFYWLFGEFEKVRGAIQSISGYPVEDYASAHCIFKKGGTGNLIALWHEIPRRSIRHIQIFFENVLIDISLHQDEGIRILKQKNRFQEISLRKIHEEYQEQLKIPKTIPQIMYFYQNLEFLRSLNGSNVLKEAPSLTDALRAHEIIDKIYNS